MVFRRDIQTKIDKYIDSEEILLLIGARRVGKTTLLKQIKAELEDDKQNCFFLNLEDPEYLKLLNENPKNLLKIIRIAPGRKSFVFIDEIQYLDNPSNFLKYFFDEYQERIKLIVSGSSAFYLDSKFNDSLAGRKKIFYIRTLSFKEFLLFKGFEELSLLDFQNLSLEEEDRVSKFFHEYIIWGAYPKVVLTSNLEEKKDILRELAYSYTKKDMLEAGVRDTVNFLYLFKILANQCGNLLNVNELANTLDISKTSVNNYLAILEKSFHISLVKPFYTNPKKEISKMPKVFFHDLGLRNFLLGDFEAYLTREDKGQVLENAVFKEYLNFYYVDDIKFWRNSEDQEVDFILDSKQAIEVKSSLKSFRESKYRNFIKSYPDIDFKLVSIDIKPEDKQLNYPVMNLWEIKDQ